jgi:hypothetical protein
VIWLSGFFSSVFFSSWGETPLVVMVRPSGLLSLTSRAAVTVRRAREEASLLTGRDVVEVLVDQLNKSDWLRQRSGMRTSVADLAMSPKLGGADMMEGLEERM